jgi:hypothetical protein
MAYFNDRGLLQGARHNLLNSQRALHTVRRYPHYDPEFQQYALDIVTNRFYRCLDRVWELQCMCESKL